MNVDEKIEELENRVIRLEIREQNERRKKKRIFWITLVIGFLLVMASMALLCLYSHIFIEILG